MGRSSVAAGEMDAELFLIFREAFRKGFYPVGVSVFRQHTGKEIAKWACAFCG